MDEQLYDEFGNYIGPSLQDSDEEVVYAEDVNEEVRAAKLSTEPC